MYSSLIPIVMLAEITEHVQIFENDSPLLVASAPQQDC